MTSRFRSGKDLGSQPRTSLASFYDKDCVLKMTYIHRINDDARCLLNDHAPTSRYLLTSQKVLRGHQVLVSLVRVRHS